MSQPTNQPTTPTNQPTNTQPHKQTREHTNTHKHTQTRTNHCQQEPTSCQHCHHNHKQPHTITHNLLADTRVTRSKGRRPACSTRQWKQPLKRPGKLERAPQGARETWPVWWHSWAQHSGRDNRNATWPYAVTARTSIISWQCSENCTRVSQDRKSSPHTTAGAQNATLATVPAIVPGAPHRAAGFVVTGASGSSAVGLVHDPGGHHNLASFVAATLVAGTGAQGLAWPKIGHQHQQCQQHTQSILDSPTALFLASSPTAAMPMDLWTGQSREMHVMTSTRTWVWRSTTNCWMERIASTWRASRENAVNQEVTGPWPKPCPDVQEEERVCWQPEARNSDILLFSL